MSAAGKICKYRRLFPGTFCDSEQFPFTFQTTSSLTNACRTAFLQSEPNKTKLTKTTKIENILGNTQNLKAINLTGWKLGAKARAAAARRACIRARSAAVRGASTSTRFRTNSVLLPHRCSARLRSCPRGPRRSPLRNYESGSARGIGCRPIRNCRLRRTLRGCSGRTSP